MTKGVRIIISILLAVFLLLSLPVLYLCAMNIFIDSAYGSDSIINNLPIYIIVSVIILLLDIIAIIGLIKIFKKIEHKNSQTQTVEDLVDTHVRRKYLQNHWFVVPLILPTICFVLNALTECMFRLMYASNIEQSTIDIFEPHFSVIFGLGALSCLLITLTIIPLAVISIVLAGIKKISLTEMFVSFVCYFFVFCFAVIAIASRV